MVVPQPIADLRRTRPDLFQAPAFWRTRLEDIAAAAASAERARVQALGRSAGGREILAFCYGPFEPQRPTATISSAMASDRPEAFYDPARRSRPALVLIGCIHGGEVEGIATCLNLVHILETGRDLSGREQPEVLSLLRRVRVVIVPCLNPDGRERAGILHLSGAEEDHIYLVQQGVHKDGSLFRGRRIKEVQPIPPGLLEFMGGYYNDADVNLQHDDFFGPALAPENRGLLDLMRREIPDGFLTLHAHGAHPSVTGPDAFLSPGYQRKQSEAGFYLLSRLAAQGLEVLDPALSSGPPWSFYFQTYFHHASGALPLLGELPHGIRQCPYTLQRILDTGLTVAACWVEFALRFGCRPRSLDLYGPPPPA
ncbi:MAG: M14 family zinc carboxypeptidase [Armatimonadota bacterium]